MFFKQQGDCMIKSTTIPKDAKPFDSQVLVESAVTGNQHKTSGKGVELLKSNNVIYIRALQDFEVIHTDPKEGHDPLQIPAGEYFVDAVQEYDHIAEEARAVAD